MPSMTVTITDNTQPARSLEDLAVNGSGAGYTVAGGYVFAAGAPKVVPAASVCYLAIQASYGNGGNYIYKGDSNVANDGTNQARELLAGSTDIAEAVQYAVNMNTIYVRGNGNSIKFNVEWHLG